MKNSCGVGLFVSCGSFMALQQLRASSGLCAEQRLRHTPSSPYQFMNSEWPLRETDLMKSTQRWPLVTAGGVSCVFFTKQQPTYSRGFFTLSRWRGIKILTRRQELGVMLNLTPAHQNIDACIKNSDAALPVSEPLIWPNLGVGIQEATWAVTNNVWGRRVSFSSSMAECSDPFEKAKYLFSHWLQNLQAHSTITWSFKFE